jgi:glycosyltransferase involved in cell wall biosynthesis
MLSIVIPTKTEIFLNKTIQEILDKAAGEVEIIVVLEGYWERPIEDKRVNYIHREARGMRTSINQGVAVSRGDYIMKLDAHCMLDEGFDLKLIEDYEDGWVVIPRRKRLDAENWCIQDVGKPDVDYEFVGYPGDDGIAKGIKGQVWTQRIVDRKHIQIDENMTFQGSCYFMNRKQWDWLGGLNPYGYGEFVREAQEICLKTWLGGGKVMTNKKTWYAHLHKGKKMGRGYFINKLEMTAGDKYCDDFWFNNRWEERIHDLSWLIERFWPVPTWPENYKELC